MREIKFKAWFSIDKKIVEHENLNMQYDRDEGFTFAFDYMSYFDEENMKGTLNFELMQFTGLKDKNGNEIYEGDIVKVLIMGGYSDNFTDREHILPVVYNVTNANYEPLDRCRMWNDEDLKLLKVEVIGNIYENADLLPKAIEPNEQPSVAIAEGEV